MSSRLARPAYRSCRVLVPLIIVATALAVVGCTSTANNPVPPVPATSTPPVTAPTTPTAAVPARPVPPTSTAPLPSATPEDAMRAWYRAWFAGDILAAQRASTKQFASTVDEGTFEGGDVTDYKVLGSEGAAGTIAFYISETREGVKGQTRMTVFVTANGSGDGYLVKGYDVTPKGTVPAETVPDSTTAVAEADARTAVTSALQALQQNDVAAAKALFTPRFVAANAAWFAPAKEALLDIPIATAARRHDVWVVQVVETWSGQSDPLFVNFLVVDVNGAALIDRVQGWY